MPARVPGSNKELILPVSYPQAVFLKLFLFVTQSAASQHRAVFARSFGGLVDEGYAQLRIGLLGLGLATYWSQFSGLESRLRGYVDTVAARLAGSAASHRIVTNLGLVDTYDRSLWAAHECRRQDVDILVVYATTYSLSSIVMPVILQAKVPVLLLNLQPSAALDYEGLRVLDDRTAMTGEWLAYCGSCPVPEIANVLRRLEVTFYQVTGMLDQDPIAWNEIEDWMRAASVAKLLRHSRLGLMGQYYGGMLDVSTDLAQVSGRLGIHIEMLELEQLSAARADVTQPQIDSELTRFKQFFAIDADTPAAELERAAHTSLALSRLVADYQLDMLAYYGRGVAGGAIQNTLGSIIAGASLLTAHGVPVAGEYEVKNVIAMKILDLLGAGGSFTEYYAMDFTDDVVLMGHDGPGHVTMAEQQIRLRPLQVYHGKAGSGLSVQMSVKHGPVTLLSLVEDRQHGFRLLLAEAESVSGPTLEIGNTNSRYRFPIGARRFVEQWNAAGPAHHCALGIGHRAEILHKLGSLLALPVTQVC
jgi:L-arabinose isomerase